MRLVLDTNVVVSALLWGGTPRSILDAARDRRLRLFTSTPLLEELTDILSRRKFQKKLNASLLTVDAIIDGYAALCVLVKPEHTEPIARDRDDDMVIGTARAAKADLIVSGDAHLLDLGQNEGITIVRVGAALDRLGNADRLLRGG